MCLRGSGLFQQGGEMHLGLPKNHD
jgi:hypothetical protein